MEVLDSSLKWWKVKNIHGQVGHLPGNQLEVIQPKKKSKSEDREFTCVFLHHIHVYAGHINLLYSQTLVDCYLNHA